MKKIALIAGLSTLAVFPTQSQAAPVSGDSMTIGSLNNTWDEWPAMWPTQGGGLWERYFMTRAPDGTTYINAGASHTPIIFLGYNMGQRNMAGGGTARAWLDKDGVFWNGGLDVARYSVGSFAHGIQSVLTGPGTSYAVKAEGPWRGVFAKATSNGGIGLEAVGGTGGRAISAGVSGSGGWAITANGYQSAGGVRAVTSLPAQTGLYASNNGGTVPGAGAAIYADGSIQGNNFVSITSGIYATGFYVTSDGRLKRDVTDFNGGLDDIEKIRVVKYKYNGKGETHDGEEHVGVVAQELEQTHPQLVTTLAGRMDANDEKTTDFKRVDQGALTYMLINAVKDLKGQVNDLQKIVCQDHPDQPSCSKKGGRRP